MPQFSWSTQDSFPKRGGKLGPNTKPPIKESKTLFSLLLFPLLSPFLPPNQTLLHHIALQTRRDPNLDPWLSANSNSISKRNHGISLQSFCELATQSIRHASPQSVVYLLPRRTLSATSVLSLVHHSLSLTMDSSRPLLVRFLHLEASSLSVSPLNRKRTVLGNASCY